ncbi:hypothetical protein KSS87_011541, partial [Heliosperma pusillum]
MASAVESTVPTSAVLMASSKHIGMRCYDQNLAFLKCKKIDANPEKCLDKGNQVTRCVFGLYVFLSIYLCICFFRYNCR